jgi:ATP-dependent exoDNAse (exonuclease V) alpha subunit
VALYFLNIKAISRSAGRSAPAAAAYRAGERIRDERTGVLHNYARRRDVIHAEIFVPGTLASEAPPWVRQRAALWNAAEAAEHRRNSRVAREYQVTLPHELNAQQRLELARNFARDLSERHSVAIDLAIHEPRPGGDPRNHHAHLLATTRELTAAGLGAKTGLDMPQTERTRRGLLSEPAEFNAIRERWATLVNDSFRAAGLEERVDHRSLKAQGIDREPVPRIPYVALQIERRGVRSEVAEQIRERYRERVAARAVAQAATHGAEVTALEPPPLAIGVAGMEELRRRARETWLQLRREALQPGNTQAARTSARDHAASAGESQSAAPDKDAAL